MIEEAWDNPRFLFRAILSVMRPVNMSVGNLASQARPRLMGIWAHPDDEAFSMAGTMARAVTAGHPVAVVSATRGEQGQIADPALATPENLGQVRERELRSACAAVGVADVSFLDYRDGHLPEADTIEAIGRLVRQIRRFQPDVVITFAANGGYGHIDHMAIHRLALAAIPAAANATFFADQIAGGLQTHRVRKLYYAAMPRSRWQAMQQAAQAGGEENFTPGGDQATIPIEQMGTPDERVSTVVTLNDAEFQAKLKSLAAHATQMPKDSPWSQATPDQLRAFMGIEHFEIVPAYSVGAFAAPEDDVFAGL
jgi:LmbE family N-acetylglucosaminyl deacetylase